MNEKNNDNQKISNEQIKKNKARRKNTITIRTKKKNKKMISTMRIKK